MPKSRKDPNKPKGAKTSFIIFGEKEREARDAKGEEIPKATEFAKVLGTLWQNLTKEEKAPYVEWANQDKKRYLKEMESYTPPSESDSDEDEKPKKKKKKIKDPNAPKRNLSAYFHFAADTRPRLKKDNPKATITTIATLVGQEWRNLKDKDKEPFEKIAAKDKERYQRELAEYNS